MHDNGLVALQARLGHSFSNPDLLVRALTHRSFSADHNERLEFLGDSVLNLAVANLLYGRLNNSDEGELSRVRASLVKQQPLYECAVKLELPKLLRLGSGESQSGGKTRPSILADALEALLGAIYLDAGYVAAEAVVHRLLSGVHVDSQMKGIAKDAKTQLQEWLQSKKKPLPAYQVVGVEGAAHSQTFEVSCSVNSPQHLTMGRGSSRRIAEQEAANAMLALLTHAKP